MTTASGADVAALPLTVSGDVSSMTQKQRMLAGMLYHSVDPELAAGRHRAGKLFTQFNNTAPSDSGARLDLLRQLLGGFDESHPPWIEAPFRCDYGSNIYMGADVYMNFGAVILDCARVTLGSRVLFGPNVQLYAATHSTDPHERNGTSGPEFGKPITIGNDCWLGGNCIILPGVTLGDGVTVGAGAVVTRDVEPYTVVAGNPARVIKRLPGPRPLAPASAVRVASPQHPQGGAATGAEGEPAGVLAAAAAAADTAQSTFVQVQATAEAALAAALAAAEAAKAAAEIAAAAQAAAAAAGLAAQEATGAAGQV